MRGRKPPCYYNYITRFKMRKVAVLITLAYLLRLATLTWSVDSLMMVLDGAIGGVLAVYWFIVFRG